MKNNYKIIGNDTIIYLKTKTEVVYETVIDTEDLDRLLLFNTTWHARYSEFTNSHYVAACEYMGIINGKPKYKTRSLHIFIMSSNPENKLMVDHIDRNTLNNRKSNLRIINQSNNLQNRNGRNKNNKSGYRNVSFYKGKYLVQLQVDNKNKCLGTFDNVEDAAVFATQMRKIHYGEFEGIS